MRAHPTMQSNRNKQHAPAKRFDLIVCATLLEKVPNFGHLTIASEVFQVSQLVIPNKNVLEDDQYKFISQQCKN